MSFSSLTSANWPMDCSFFPTQGSSLGLLDCRRILYRLSHQRSPRLYITLHYLIGAFICVLCRTQSLSHVWLFKAPETAAPQAPLSMGSSRQEYWSGLPFLTAGDLPDPQTEPVSPASPALAGRFFILHHLRSPTTYLLYHLHFQPPAMATRMQSAWGVRLHLFWHIPPNLEKYQIHCKYWADVPCSTFLLTIK